MLEHALTPGTLQSLQKAGVLIEKSTHAQCPVELLGLCGRVPTVETSPSVSQLINVPKPAVEKRSIIAVVIITQHQYTPEN